MTEEMPKNYRLLKFIVIFMGILIVVGLAVVVWKVIDLAQKRTVRQGQQVVVSEQIPHKFFEGELRLAPGEKILGTSASAAGLWIRVGQGDHSTRLIFKGPTGATLGMIRIKRPDENP